MFLKNKPLLIRKLKQINIPNLKKMVPRQNSPDKIAPTKKPRQNSPRKNSPGQNSPDKIAQDKLTWELENFF